MKAPNRQPCAPASSGRVCNVWARDGSGWGVTWTIQRAIVDSHEMRDACRQRGPAVTSRSETCRSRVPSSMPQCDVFVPPVVLTGGPADGGPLLDAGGRARERCEPVRNVGDVNAADGLTSNANSRLDQASNQASALN
jgi:hypothetical protein